jgi:transcriptional regulator with XRE-family HTH domain
VSLLPRSRVVRVSESSYRRLQRTLAANVRRYRKERQLTQEAAAQAMGMATRHFQKLESGELNVTLRTLAAVAKALGVNIADLVSDSDND